MEMKEHLLFLVFIFVQRVPLVRGSCRDMLFKWETSGKALTMFVFKTIDNIDNRLCRAKCFIEQNRCLSYNYHINSKTCELSESDHFINPEKMINRPGSLYTAAENTCKCAKHELCRYKPSSDTFYCLCNDNYPGSNCLATTTQAVTTSTATNTGESTTKPTTVTTQTTATSTGSPSTQSTSTSTTTAATTGSPNTQSSTSTSATTAATTGSPSTQSTSTSTTTAVTTGSPSTQSTSTSTTTAATTGSPSTQSTSTSATTAATTGSPSTQSTSTSTTTAATTRSPSTQSTSTSTTTAATTGSPSTQSTSTSTTTAATTGASSAQSTSPTTAAGKDCQIDFPRKSIEDYVEIPSALAQEVTSFTLSFWLKPFSSFEDILQIFSYSDNKGNTDMSLAIKDDGVAEMKIAGGGAGLKSHITMDDTWQNFIIVWRNSDGLLRLFKNGGNKESEKASEGKTVKTGGTMYLGQKHKDDGFDESKLVRGSIADFEIWSNWITDGTAIKIYNYNCQTAANFIPGDILSWDKILKSAMTGNVKHICPSTCKKP